MMHSSEAPVLPETDSYRLALKARGELESQPRSPRQTLCFGSSTGCMPSSSRWDFQCSHQHTVVSAGLHGGASSPSRKDAAPPCSSPFTQKKTLGPEHPAEASSGRSSGGTTLGSHWVGRFWLLCQRGMFSSCHLGGLSRAWWQQPERDSKGGLWAWGPLDKQGILLGAEQPDTLVEPPRSREWRHINLNPHPTAENPSRSSQPQEPQNSVLQNRNKVHHPSSDNQHLDPRVRAEPPASVPRQSSARDQHPRGAHPRVWVPSTAPAARQTPPALKETHGDCAPLVAPFHGFRWVCRSFLLSLLFCGRGWVAVPADGPSVM